MNNGYLDHSLILLNKFLYNYLILRDLFILIYFSLLKPSLLDCITVSS